MHLGKLKKLVCLLLAVVLLAGCVRIENDTGMPEEAPRETEAEPEESGDGYVDSSLNAVGGNLLEGQQL